MKKILAASLLIYMVTLSAMNSGGEGSISRTFTNKTLKNSFIFIVNNRGRRPRSIKTLKPNTSITIDYYNTIKVVVGQTTIEHDHPKRNFIIKKDRNGELRLHAE